RSRRSSSDRWSPGSRSTISAPSACPRSPSPPDGSPPSRSSRPVSSSRGSEPRKHPRGVILLPLLPSLLRAHGTAGDAMSKVFMGGFVVIAAVAVAAVEYVNQPRRAGSAPGAFAVAACVGTGSGRTTGAPAPAAAPAAAGATEPPPATAAGEADRLTQQPAGAVAVAEA